MGMDRRFVGMDIACGHGACFGKMSCDDCDLCCRLQYRTFVPTVQMCLAIVLTSLLWMAA